MTLCVQRIFPCVRVRRPENSKLSYYSLQRKNAYETELPNMNKKRYLPMFRF